MPSLATEEADAAETAAAVVVVVMMDSTHAAVLRLPWIDVTLNEVNRCFGADVAHHGWTPRVSRQSIRATHLAASDDRGQRRLWEIRLQLQQVHQLYRLACEHQDACPLKACNGSGKC